MSTENRTLPDTLESALNYADEYSFNSSKFLNQFVDFSRAIAGYESPNNDAGPLFPYTKDKTSLSWSHNYTTPLGQMVLFNTVPNIIDNPEWTVFSNNIKMTRDIDLNTGAKVRRLLDECQSIDVYNESLDIAIEFELYDPFVDYTVYFDSERYVDDQLDEIVHSLLFTPDPYEGKIIQISEDGFKILRLEEQENLMDYEPEVERALSWLTSITQETTRNRLRAAGLPLRAGLILAGPPGSGKTTLARRTACRVQGDVTVIYPTSDVGITTIVDTARTFDCSLVVLEDVDSFFGARGSASFSNFLNVIDGVDNEDAIMFLATSNDTSELDPAVRRPGRLERQVVIDSINPNAIPNMIAERLPEVEDPQALADKVVARYNSLETNNYITPAVIDSFARSVILEGIPVEDYVEYLETVWTPTFVGDNYLD